MSLSDIAEELHVEPHSVSKLISDRRKTEAGLMTAEEKEGILDMEKQRLEYYLTQLWPGIEEGDPKSIAQALNVHDRIMRAYQFDKVEASTGQATVLIMGDVEDDYVNKLKELADGS